MTMRDQIETGVYNAIGAAASSPALSSLADLGDAEAQSIVDAVLAALSVSPEGSTSPSVTVTPAATPMLVLSVEDVIAAAARSALGEAQIDGFLMEDRRFITATWDATENFREVREFLFRVQHLFGVRVRSTRADDNTPVFYVAGQVDQVNAFQRNFVMLRDLAQPMLADMDANERREFWATLGDFCTDPALDNTEHLVEMNRENVDRATALLVEVYGPARNLPRTEPVTSGAVFDAAATIAARSMS